MSDVDKIERQRKHFNDISELYYNARNTANPLLIKHLIWKDFLSEKKELKQNNTLVLEAMCGFAEGKELLEKHLGIQIVYRGTDYSDEVVKRVRQNYPDLDVMQQDVTKFTPDKLYDIVMVIGGLHHVPDMAQDVVSRLSSAIRPGGYFINFEPTSGNPLFCWIREYIYKHNKLFDEQTERAFSLPELFQMFKSANLSLVDVMYPGLLAYVLYYNPDAIPALNIGGVRWVKAIHAMDRIFYRTIIGRWLSFATLTLWQKPVLSSGHDV